jgi:6-phosphogluconolactonase
MEKTSMIYKWRNRFFMISLICCSTLYAQHTCVFVGSFNWSKDSAGIFVYELDTVAGTLHKVTDYTGISNPSYLTVSSSGKYIYACTESKTPNAGSVSSFKFNYKDKSLRFINSQPSNGENPVYLDVSQDGMFLIEANYTESSFSIYPLSPDGSIYFTARHLQFTEGSHVNATRQDTSHVHAVVFSPDGKFIFLTDLGADKIRVYRFEDSSELLFPISPSFLTTYPGSGPRHLTFHPNGQFAYCIEELTGSIEVYRYNNGRLSYLQRILTHPDELKEGFESSDIHVSPDGQFLYASNRGKENNIAIFSIAANGTLQSKGYQSTLGIHPRIFALDESGKFLIVSNVTTGNLVVFRRDVKTGLLEKTSEITGLKNPSCVKIKRYN